MIMQNDTNRVTVNWLSRVGARHMFTENTQVDSLHEITQMDWPDNELDERFDADIDIDEGRVRSFDSIDEMIQALRGDSD